jgi:hypothetical protein
MTLKTPEMTGTKSKFRSKFRFWLYSVPATGRNFSGILNLASQPRLGVGDPISWGFSSSHRHHGPVTGVQDGFTKVPFNQHSFEKMAAQIAWSSTFGMLAMG